MSSPSSVMNVIFAGFLWTWGVTYSCADEPSLPFPDRTVASEESIVWAEYKLELKYTAERKDRSETFEKWGSIEVKLSKAGAKRAKLDGLVKKAGVVSYVEYESSRLDLARIGDSICAAGHYVWEMDGLDPSVLVVFVALRGRLVEVAGPLTNKTLEAGNVVQEVGNWDWGNDIPVIAIVTSAPFEITAKEKDSLVKQWKLKAGGLKAAGGSGMFED